MNLSDVFFLAQLNEHNENRKYSRKNIAKTNKIRQNVRTMRDAKKDIKQLPKKIKGCSRLEIIFRIYLKRGGLMDMVQRFLPIAKITPKLPILARYVARLHGIVPKAGTRANKGQVITRGCRYPYKTFKYKIIQKHSE